jgi:hypothetical protein
MFQEETRAPVENRMYNVQNGKPGRQPQYEGLNQVELETTENSQPVKKLLKNGRTVALQQNDRNNNGRIIDRNRQTSIRTTENTNSFIPAANVVEVT